MIQQQMRRLPRRLAHGRRFNNTSPNTSAFLFRTFSATTVTTSSSSSSNGTAPSSSTTDLTHHRRPSEVVSELDRHIVGQRDAKRAVAIALRNRWRRQQLPENLKAEVTPRNVLLVGPTGCGKTEVARRMAQLNDAPFLKVEATKFTEVGYHGRDVDQIIRDLMDVSIQLTRKVWTEKLRTQAQAMVEDRILDALVGPQHPAASASRTANVPAPAGDDDTNDNDADAKKEAKPANDGGRSSFREMLREGMLDDQEITVEVPEADRNNNDLAAGGDGSNPNVAVMNELMQRISENQKRPSAQKKKLPIAQARAVIEEVELNKLLEKVDLKKEAILAVEESGIVFIDEIDKICSARDMSSRGPDASAEGVQRDLLPLIEGCTINTKYGNVKTDYILFLASGAFHSVKPSDMLPELQGRLPIRVELQGLTEDDLYRILTEPVANLVRQQVELIATEGVTLDFTDAAIREIAAIAADLNATVENIGARRLHTVVETVMEELSFQAAELEAGATLTVDPALVTERMEQANQGSKPMAADLSKYIL